MCFVHILQLYMQKYTQNNTKTSKKQARGCDLPIVTEFGVRAIVTQNFSKLVALPKIALANCGLDKNVRVQLVYDNGEKYLKLSPTKDRGGETVE